MKNKKAIAVIISALIFFVCSATAFAEEVPAATDSEPTSVATVTEVTETDAAEVSTKEDAETAADEKDEGVTVIREEVTLDNTEPAETEIVIDTSNVSIEEQKPDTAIVVDYDDTTTEIPNTGSSKVIGAAVFSIPCCAGAIIITLKKKKG
ncbi:MAG: hypothetical protein IJ050_05980 [Clostridia bacterium]|nr:hypothetical protein [Clostridia bacterium]